VLSAGVSLPFAKAPPVPSVSAIAAASIMVLMVSLLDLRSRAWGDLANAVRKRLGQGCCPSVCGGVEIDLLPADNNPAFLEFIFA
jgi:hypothetical protein